jgi:putative addiction module component (TIGR02574 family)
MLSSTLGGVIFSATSPFTYRKELTMADPNAVLKEALTLKPAQKAELIDKLLSSLDKPDKDIDELWAKEAESRIDAYEKGKIKAVTLERVLEKYK